MLESILTLMMIGLLAGFIFSIPVAGPINIIITTNALAGKLRFCLRTALGSCILEFFYVLIVVFGITSLYSLYKPIIPYLLTAGSIILIFVGIRIIKTKLDVQNLESKSILKDKIQNKGGLRTGILINLTNPSLFLGWLISTFVIFSFASSIGLNTGGLDFIVNQNVESLKEIAGEEFEQLQNLQSNPDTHPTVTSEANTSESLSPILLAAIYALSVAVGSYIWLWLYSKLIVKYRQKFNLNLLTNIIRSLGVCLILLSIYLGYKAFDLIFS